jgi:hypothetical protein
MWSTAFLLLLLTAPCGNDADSGGATRPDASTSAANPSSLADAVDTVGRTRFADQYAGITVQGATVTVYRRPGSGLDDAVRALPDGSAVRFQDARYSLTQLQPLRERIEADIAYWAGRGITISAVSVPPDGSGVEVTTPQADRARTELPARYGPDPVLHVIGGGPVTPVPATS